MLAKALHEHTAAPTQKAPTLSQQLFPSSSPIAEQAGFRTGSQKTTPPARHLPSSGNILRPSSSAVLNGSRGALPFSSNPLKRTAAQAIGTDRSLSRQDLKMSRQDSTKGNDSAVRLPQTSMGGGRVGKLHDAVYFDENDFDDDQDLDLDGEALPTSHNGRALSYSSPEKSRAESQHVTPEKKFDVSSMPLPWSSSPPEHKATQSKAESRHQPSLFIEGNVTYPVLKNPPPSSDPPVSRPNKRRTFPWLDNDGQAVGEKPRETIQDYNERQTGRASKKRGEDSDEAKTFNHHRGPDNPKGYRYKNMKSGAADSFTPLPKDQSNSAYPWNKTASAVKEEQKKLRQANKKLMKYGETSGDAKAASVFKKPSVARVFLSDEQKRVLNLVAEEKKSAFFTGSAGTGKSVLLREIIKVLRDKFKREPDRVAVTASTGLAACNVGGVTLHSFGGIGLGKEAVPELVKKIKRNIKAKTRWLRTKVLIIDEISMVDGDLFDKLEGIARIIRNNGRPFGGIQLVITGDFFQLPPVPDSGRVAKFAFDAATWNTSIEHTIGLTQVFRQKDPVFANMLNEMRLGKLSQKSINTFRGLNRPLTFTDDFEATELFPTRHEVDNANNLRMRNLGGDSWNFKAEDSGSIQDISQREKLLSNCMAPPLITLKKGAQVMLIKNMDETLVNGSLGKVIAFMDEKTFDIYHEDEDEFQAVETMDLDEEGMTRSRMKLKALINKDLIGNTSQKWPLVRFAIGDGSTRDLLCQRESWKIELPTGEVQASRSQIPLILAWSLSIHKAQGQTLERVKVDLGKIFEKGQAYVALSRATCQEGLQILRFDPKKVMAHEKVREFYDSLYSIDKATKSRTQGSSKNTTERKDDYQVDFLQADSAFDDEDALQQMYG